MIIVRAPVRMSFVGGGTDFEAFYRHSPGRVISTAIDKYIYITINRPPLVDDVTVRYSASEAVRHPSELQHDRVREALLHFGIFKNVDVGTFSDVPVKTGLGSSSSFSVALMKALTVSQGGDASEKEIAELAAHLEIDLLREPIGKQDHYAAAIGGCNVFQFNADGSVDIEPVPLDRGKQLTFEHHIHLFYTGITRLASSVLVEQQANTEHNEEKFETLKKMADLVPEFRAYLLAGDFKNMGAVLQKNWRMKKTLASAISNPTLDELYAAGMNAGAWGGKVLGAGGGGCIVFLASPERRDAIRNEIAQAAKRHGLNDFKEIPVCLAQKGMEVLLNNGT